MDSVWTKDSARITFSELDNNIKTDVLIIGGGMAGILTAKMLKDAGVDCVLVEAKRICDGITKNTTAKITLQHGLIYDKITSRYGKENAQKYLTIQKKACNEYSKLCKNIDCDYEIKDSFVYSLDDRKKIEDEIKALNDIGAKAVFSDSVNLPFDIAGAVKIENQAQFNPLKFAFNIAKDLNIFENTKVLEIMPSKAVTNHGEISCKKIIIATHFPILNKHGGFPLKMYQHRSYVLALENAADVNGMYVDEAQKGLSFRNYNNLLLLGGGDHRTGKNGGCWQELEEFSKKYYPDARIKYRWATQDCMTLDGIPYIGRYAADTENLYVATGFNKWGMSSSMVSSMILTDIILGKNNIYASLFDPSRSILHPQLILNIFESVLGIITPTRPRCPHLGCALKYNKEEHSWDCPCHGSRFSDTGELIDNPATDDKKL